MNYQHRIIGLWGLSALLLIAAVSASYLFQTRTNNQATLAMGNLPTHQDVSPSENQLLARSLGRQIIAQVYNEPNLELNSAVLGEFTPAPLKQEEIADITTSTVIRVFNHVEGSISLPEFDIDLFNIQLRPNGKTYTEEGEVLTSGTGFFVDDQGHIITNAHVVSKDALLEDFTGGVLYYYGGVMRKQIELLDDATLQALESKLLALYGDDPQTAALLLAADLSVGIEKYITENAKITAKQTVTVLDPHSDPNISTSEDLKKLLDKGFEAEVIDYKKDYAKTHKDVGLIKISNTPTPYLTLNSDSKPSTGQQIYLMGYPANADVDNADLFNRTMTQGTINSVKKVEGTEVYQTDAKISQGSSGSPMLNEKGEVIGIISFLNNGIIGDNFGFAVPIEHAITMMANNKITVTSNPYMTNFTEGLALAQQSLCRKANAQFAISQNSSQTFSNSSLQKYIDRCNEVIEAGDSKDGTLYGVTAFIKNIPVYAWAGGIVLVVISIAAVIFIRKYRHVGIAPPPQATFA